MKLIDTHCHINLDDYKEDLDKVLERIKEQLDFVINVGYDEKTCDESVMLADKYEYIYATVGIHPHDAKSYSEAIEEKIITLLNNKKVLAVGEIGLDYYRDLSPRDIQQETFRKQLRLAEKYEKPVVIHCRDAYKDTVDILNEFPNIKGIMHSYSGSFEVASMLLDRFYMSISGPLTFKNAANMKELIKKLPIEKILVETDSPYLTPEPYRGKRNEPCYVEYVAREIARLKEIDYEEVVRITNENSRKAFGVI